MREAFLSVDSEFLEMAGEKDWYSGTTVLVALMRGRYVQPSFNRFFFFLHLRPYFFAGCSKKKIVTPSATADACLHPRFGNRHAWNQTLNIFG